MNLLDIPEFRSGLALGAITAVVLAGVGVWARWRRRWTPVPAAGLVLAAGGLWTIADATTVPAAVVVGVVGVGLAAGLVAVPSVPWWYGAALALPFGWVLGFHSGVVEITWVQALVAAAASAGAVAVAEFDHEWRTEAPAPALLALSVVGAYLAVPDTEEVAALVGVAAPLAVLGWPVRLVRLGRPGAAAAVATLTWASAIGARGRPASLIGAVAGLGVLVGVPVGRALFSHRRPSWATSRLSTIAILAVGQLALVVVASRVAGRLAEPLAAASVAALVGAAAVGIGIVVTPPDQPGSSAAARRSRAAR